MTFPAFLFPAFFVIVVFVVALPAVITMVYLQVYKRYVNRVFNSDKAHSTMVPPYKIVIILTVMVLFLGVLLSLSVGYKIGNAEYEKNLEELSAFDFHTFYAEVSEVSEHTITLNGISLNEGRYRGEFQYEVWGETSIAHQNQPIALSDLKPGDLVSVILTTDKNAVTELFKIQLIAPNS